MCTYTLDLLIELVCISSLTNRNFIIFSVNNIFFGIWYVNRKVADLKFCLNLKPAESIKQQTSFDAHNSIDV